MEKSVNYKNVWEMIHLFLNDSFHGICNRSILRNAYGRVILSILFCSAYFLYFYVNAIEFAKLGQTRQIFSVEELNKVIKLSIASYNNLSFILGILIYQLAQQLILIKNSSLFIVKSLPYPNKEINFAIHLFKLGVSSIIYELFFIVLMPGLQVIGSVNIALFLFCSCHLFFLIGYLTSFHAYRLANKYLDVIYLKIKPIISVIILSLTAYYYYIGRFIVEFALSKQVSNALVLSIYSFIFSLVISILIFSFFSFQNEEYFFKNVYLPLAFPKYVPRLLLGLLRTKLFAISNGILFLLSLYTFTIAGCKAMLEVTAPLYPLLNIIFLRYIDTTIHVRKLFNHLNITVIQEWLSILFSILIYQLPLIVLQLVLPMDFRNVCFGQALALASVIIGYLFPKSESSLNDTVAVILLFLIVVIIIMVKSSTLSIVIAYSGLSLFLFYLLVRERRLT